MRNKINIIEKQLKISKSELSKLLIEARDIQQALIIKYTSKGNYIGSSVIRDELYKNLTGLYATLGEDINKWIKFKSEEIAKEWRQLAIEDMPKGKYKQTFASFSKKYLKDIFERTTPNLAATNAILGGMLNEDVNMLRKSFVDVQRLGSLSGMTSKQMQNEMISRIKEINKNWTFIDKSGRQWDTKNYFSMLNNTVNMNTSREAYLDTMVEAGYDLATIEGVEDSTDVCAEWVGEIISISGATEGYPTESDAKDAGVFHPNCRHFLVAYIKDEEVTKS